MADRSKYIGKTMWINTTCYFNDEIFQVGNSVCVGVLDDLSSFKFSSNDNRNDDSKYSNFNLGCASTRSRGGVFIDEKTVFDFIKKKLSERSSNPEYYAIVYNSKYEIELLGYNLIEDKWTGESNFQSIHRHKSSINSKYIKLGKWANFNNSTSKFYLDKVDNIDSIIKEICNLMSDLFIYEFETKCSYCGKKITEGDSVYMFDGDEYCSECCLFDDIGIITDIVNKHYMEYYHSNK